MRTRWIRGWIPMIALAATACSAGNSPHDGGRADSSRDAVDEAPGQDTSTGPDVRNNTCVDSDGDGISDAIEGPGDDDGDGIPNAMDTDSDNDGFSDADEAIGNYPGFSSSRPALTCGSAPDDCDMDGTSNYFDVDSDNDGLTDPEELTAHTNPCEPDTDSDGYSDLTEVVAGTDPSSQVSQPPLSSLYVTLPYHDTDDPGLHVHKSFTFATQIRAADIMFLIDTTGSMQDTIDNVQSTLSSQIIPMISAALGPRGDARYGIAAHGDYAEGDQNIGPIHQSDGAMTVHQKLDPDPALSQFATGQLSANLGGDFPEAQVAALHSLVSGFGLPEYGGTATRMVDPINDCNANPDDPPPFGWACFLPGRVPILVHFSDADWHNGPGQSNFYTSVPMAARYSQLQSAMQAHGALFVGIDVNPDSAAIDAQHPMGYSSGYSRSITLAAGTGTLDANRHPIAFRGSASTVATNVIDAITTIIGQTRQDVTTRVDPDAAETRLPAGRTTADFLKSVKPESGSPPAPDGYDSQDDTTFYGVLPSTTVTFTVDFYNDFQMGGHSAQVFRATIVVLGRANSELDSRQVLVVVPAQGAQPPG